MVQLESQITSGSPAAYRSRLFGLLSTAHRYPSATLHRALADGEFQTQVGGAVAGLPYRLAADAVVGPVPALARAALHEAYTNLFDVGSPSGPPCCLYEGEYGGGRMRVMEDLLRFYHFFGLRLSTDERDRPDHLATELEFLHWLTFREASALAQGSSETARIYRTATRDFLAQHTGELLGQVVGRVGTGDLPVYPELLRLAADFCARDLAYLRQDGAESADRPALDLPLTLWGLQLGPNGDAAPGSYSLRALRAQPMEWDRIVKGTHSTNCWYMRCCNYNLYVSDGVVLREEQAGNYPPQNDPSVPDHNPRGCQKGACYSHHTYDPTRLKYPLKRVGERGSGRWQRVSWDEALTDIADRMLDVIVSEGVEAIVQGGGTSVHSESSEGVGTTSLFGALGIAYSSVNIEIGDDHQGAALTVGTSMFADSADNWFHSDVLLLWGGNPSYTNIASYHYISEARWKGTKVIVISPDYNATAVHADEWVPVNIGTDAALALAMCGVILREGLHRAGFVREQTDMPLLVRVDNGRLLREKDLKRGGRDDIFYVYDEASRQVVEAPRKTLALNGLLPALDGEYEVHTPQGAVCVRPVIEVLRERLNRDYAPPQAASITGVPAPVIERLAREIARTERALYLTTANWGKFYHGDLIQRACFLLFALCGHVGRKGASFSAFPLLSPDTSLGPWIRPGQQVLQSVAAEDPRYAGWREDGYTDEMILSEFAKTAVSSRAIISSSMFHFFHGGIYEQSERYENWDPHLKRPLRSYITEALDKGWQNVIPPPDKEPRILFVWGGDVFRRARATRQFISTLLPKLQLIVSVDWRMSASGLYADYNLPACGWYERTSTNTFSSTQSPFLHVNEKAIEPLYESLSDWTIVVRLARTLSQRARERGILSFRDANGNERRLDRLEEIITAGGLYTEDDEEGVARDVFLNATNCERIDWEEFKRRGIATFSSIGKGAPIGNSCDALPGEPIVPLSWHTEKKEPYPTLTRRLQFYIDQDWYLELDEHLPFHKDCPKAGGDYPLQVTGGHARWSIHTDWADDSILLGLQRGEPLMFISTKDAESRGIRDGDFVEVFNDVGDFRIQAAVSPTVRPGQVIIYHAWENYQFEGWRHFRSVFASPLNPIEMVGGYGHIRPDAFSFSPGPNDRGTRVEVRSGS